ncbi:hypothetical protein DE146DRAFT_755007 [Phaeosphaeria sp. MPI-PUGE-AT-0046c]|nr:hypothetical protein DE146DRAFT_755007 [Phaeosphaeria sp. MPI-PUGE-AT-0046c]
MASPSLGSFSLAILMTASCLAAPIAPSTSLAERDRPSFCDDKDNVDPAKWRTVCATQYVPAEILPPAEYVWRRDKPHELKSTYGNEDLVYPRDEVTHLPAPNIYSVHSNDHVDNSGAGTGNLPQWSGNDKTSGSGQGQHWGTVPNAMPVGNPKSSLPVEKPAPMIRRRADAESSYGTYMVTHHRADQLWRRTNKGGRGDDFHNTERTNPHSDNLVPQSDKSEAEQLFEQSRSANKMASLDSKLTIMQPALNVYRRTVLDKMSPGRGVSRVPSDSLPPSGHHAQAETDPAGGYEGRLITLQPADGVYRRSQDIESLGQSIRGPTGDNSAPLRSIYDAIAAINSMNNLKSQKRNAQNVEFGGQNTEFDGRDPESDDQEIESEGQDIESEVQDGQYQSEDDIAAAAERLRDALAALNVQDQPELGKRSFLPSRNVDSMDHNTTMQDGGESTAAVNSIYDALTALTGKGHSTSSKRSVLPALDQRDLGLLPIFRDIKDKLDRIKPAPGGGDSARGGDTAKPRPVQADSKSSPKKRSQSQHSDTEVVARSPEVDHLIVDPDLLFSAPAVAHYTTDQVYRSRAYTEALDESSDMVERSVPAPDLEMPEQGILPPSPEEAANHTSPEPHAYDDSLTDMRATLAQLTELCKSTLFLEHFETDSVEKCQSEIREALLHVDSEDEEASTDDAPSDHQAIGDDSTMHKRGRVSKPQLDDIGTADGLPGSHKHVALDRLKIVYRRSNSPRDRIKPHMSAHYAHDRVPLVYGKGTEVHEKRGTGLESSMSTPHDDQQAASAVKSHDSPSPEQGDDRILARGVTLNGIDRGSNYPPKYRVNEPANSVFRTEVAQKRAAKKATGRAILRPLGHSPYFMVPTDKIHRRGEPVPAGSVSKRCYNFLDAVYCLHRPAQVVQDKGGKEGVRRRDDAPSDSDSTHTTEGDGKGDVQFGGDELQVKKNKSKEEEKERKKAAKEEEKERKKAVKGEEKEKKGDRD